jgi:hypothetical protein
MSADIGGSGRIRPGRLSGPAEKLSRVHGARLEIQIDSEAAKSLLNRRLTFFS